MLSRFRSLGLATRIIGLTLLVLITVVAVNYAVFVDRYRGSAEKAMVEKAAAFTAVADETKDHVSKLNEEKAIDHEALLAQLAEDQEAGRPYTESKIFQTIPVVAGWLAAEEAAEREGIDFRITADAAEARNRDNAPATEFDRQLLEKLHAQVAAAPNDPAATMVHAIEQETNTLHYMRAIKLTPDCMMCHGHPDTSPNGDGTDVLGFPMENWQVGKMHGAYHVKMPVSKVDDQVAGFIGFGLIWTVPMIIGATILFVVLLRLMFGKPVANLIERIRDIAEGEGDLTQRIEVRSNDELGQLGHWFNAFVQRIHDVIAEVAGSSRDVASASTQIAASTEEIAAGMNEQSGQVTQISSAIEEMSSSVVEVARKAADAANNANESGRMAQEGGEVVEQTITGMNAISESVSSSAVAVQELGKRGEQIGEVIEVINDIADQTNLLALNAAIEAARAGEHGRGFAVVADEVRKLADRTTKATEEVAQSITAIQQETQTAVGRMEAGTQEVDKGVEKAGRAGQSLQQIVSSASDVASMVQSIAAAAEEQSAASEQVSRNIESISAISRQANEGTSQAAQAAQSLSSKAESLLQLVGSFKIDSSAVQTAKEAPMSDDEKKLREAARTFREQHA
jgi:methyl-accepting chemotaxis protein